MIQRFYTTWKIAVASVAIAGIPRAPLDEHAGPSGNPSKTRFITGWRPQMLPQRRNEVLARNELKGLGSWVWVRVLGLGFGFGFGLGLVVD